MRSRSAAFEDAFKRLQDNHGYTKHEMLVLVKAYESYNSDMALGKSSDDSGWLDVSYDIAPGIFHASMQKVVITDLRDKAPGFWESNDKDGRLRLSKNGRLYIEEHSDLVVSAKSILAGVSHVRRN